MWGQGYHNYQTTHDNRYIGRFEQRSLFKQNKREKRRDVSPTGLHRAKDLRRLTEDGVKKTEKRLEKGCNERKKLGEN